MPLGSSVFCDTQEEQRFMQHGALLYLCFMFARGFAVILLLGILGVEVTRMVSCRLAFVSFVTLKKNRALCNMVHYHICASCWCVVLQPFFVWWNGRGGLPEWSPAIPDLTQRGLFLWGWGEILSL